MKKIFTLILALFMGSIFCGCKNQKNDNFQIVTSCYPVYIMALNITEGISGIEVVNMSENHKGCLHDFKLQSEDLKRIEKSSVFIINGAGMESFLDKILNELPKLKIIDSARNIDLIKDDDCHDEEEEECHHEYNPHTWVSISNYIKQVNNIAENLSEIDSVHAEQYLKNAEIYTKKLNTLKNDMHSQLDNVQNKNIITFHEAFPYFAQEFGLNIAAVINHEPDADPNAQELSQTIATAKNMHINALFVEPQYSSVAAEVISKETGAKIYTLDPAATGENSRDSYINIMNKNLEILKLALN